ncbi:hypothetical protein F0562_018115 [Nyssa sinensis]|uniref:Protein kinase domain-containing protein n=1 Tax=Nyssa sinensis TaxID=561372 RepID=A0A5J4ZC44_9ASTE|nr:hypothetical protein F0562_018115 [Nyssa sinensis]
MVYQEMGVRWYTFGVRLSCFALLILGLEICGCCALNCEGLALFDFRARVDYDPYGAFANWNPNDNDPCMWSGVHCVDGKVQILDLNGLSLGGLLAPELGNLTHLKSLVLNKNQFFGAIPEEIGGLSMLEVLDLRDNNLSGNIPAEIGGLQSLKCLLLCNNKFEGSIPPELGKLNLLSELQFDENLTYAVDAGISCVNRKFGHWFKIGKGSLHSDSHNFCDNPPTSPEPHIVQNVQNLVNSARRRLLQQSSNLAAAPASGESPPGQIIALSNTRSSGSFPAVPNGKKGPSETPAPSPDSSSHQTHNTSDPNVHSPGSVKKPTDVQPSTGETSGNRWKYIVGVSGMVLSLIVAAAMFFMCQNRSVSTIGPWKTGLSGQLQKAFVTGVPKLNRTELETACEDFSNIIETVDGCTIYKGTLSSGVEIAVASIMITSIKDWSKRSERAYRKKIDMLSRVNHKNFVNLIGYCEEDEPFVRMMVFEYAPNGTLFEHLHVKEVEHLDWNARTRVIMGTAYCLQYMHDLNPPVAHTNLNSNSIYLTDDYAAKIAEVSFSIDVASKRRISGESESEHSELPPLADLETNVYSFGLLLLEIISGKLPYTKEQGTLVNWAAEYLNDTRSISYMIDPTLKSFKNDELDIICEVIRDCIQQDARKRPTMKEITSKLREVISISPDQATPRLSPLWWAELEILSVEAA